MTADAEAAARVQAFAAGVRYEPTREVGLYVLQQRNVVESPDRAIVEASRDYAIGVWLDEVRRSGWLSRCDRPGTCILAPPDQRAKLHTAWAWWYVWGPVLV